MKLGEYGDPGRNAKIARYPYKNKHCDRDTVSVSSSLQVNSLDRHTGHATPRKSPGNSKHIKPEHKRLARMIGFCLTLGTYDAWSSFARVASARLDATERGALAFAALNSLELEHAELTAATVLGRAGNPLPAFLGGMDEARHWASYASRSELRAIALAAYEAMSAKDQAAFFRHIGEVEIPL